MLALKQSAESRKSDLLVPGGGSSDCSDPPPLATGLHYRAVIWLSVSQHIIINRLPDRYSWPGSQIVIRSRKWSANSSIVPCNVYGIVTCMGKALRFDGWTMTLMPDLTSCWTCDGDSGARRSHSELSSRRSASTLPLLTGPPRLLVTRCMGLVPAWRSHCNPERDAGRHRPRTARNIVFN